MTPEIMARIEIDKKLQEAGYVLQDMNALNPNASLGVAVREFQTESGPVDYLIFIGGKAVGVIEAKSDDKGEVLLTVSEQANRYIKSGLKYDRTQTANLRFAYVATGVRTCFYDYNDDARTREVFTFHRPEKLAELLKDALSIRKRMKDFPELDVSNFRDCQVKAILNLEKSFGENRPRALIQMATGAGKTYTAISSVYRLLKFAKVKRVLFLVDTKNLGEQAEQEFRAYKPNDDTRSFTDLYNVRRLNSSDIPQDANICISTIQRMYSILKGEELDEGNETISLYEQGGAISNQKQKEVVYNAKCPIEFFDAIVIDECHRSIYNLWKQVLDYFDAFLIGLTATPDKRTFGFFNENIVSEYTHEQAVIDGVNVGRQGTYIIETEITANGGTVLKGIVEKRERLSRRRRWEQQDEDKEYKPNELDEKVVNLSQIRNIVKAYKESLFTELFPNRKEVPKTLIFAKTDSHADDIITIVREEFGENDEFCKKVTYNAENPQGVLGDFRNSYNPRIAITVDMIATGTDVKPIECLIFMRDVRSKNYFEQMLGRATRTLGADALRQVSPSAVEAKTGFIVVDAVGVTKSQKTTSRQLERKPTESLYNLMMSVVLGETGVDTLTTLAYRLLLLERILTNKEKQQLAKIVDEPLNKIAGNLLNAFDEDIITDTARAKFALSAEQEPTEEQKKQTQCKLIAEATAPIFKPEFRDFVLNARKMHDQILDPTLDKVITKGFEDDLLENAEKIIATFHDFIESHKDDITALSIIYSQSYKTRHLTYQMIENLYDALNRAPYSLTQEKLWRAYGVKFIDKVKKRVEDKLADIVSLVRFELGQTSELNLFSAMVELNFKNWMFAKQSGSIKFTSEQKEWLCMIRDHIATSVYVEEKDLDYVPFGTKGGLAKYYELFGNKYLDILNEINYALTA
ncbi:MAG: DEAD/DEAH box helicase family protein [Christensenellaceae bacterium]|jgi:type I restriction enzyme R subunit|nr:DEAD/DEAH box helicase family protein [Christensenellaceae bacterium]